MSNLFVVNAFVDLKQKSSGGGGFSDGGVINRSVALKEAGQSPVVVEIAPPPGVVYSGIDLDSQEGDVEPGSVVVLNFDAALDCAVTEFFVTEDGTEVPTAAPTNVLKGEISPIDSSYFGSAGLLQYPNKLRYKVAGKPGLPTGRVLLKYTVLQYDRPADQG